MTNRLSATVYSRAFAGRLKPFYVFLLILASLFQCRSTYAQNLNWSSPTEYSPIQVGGQSNGLGGVGVALWNNRVWVAYTDNSGNGNLWLTSTTDGVSFAPPVQVVSPSQAQTVVSVANPSLAVFNNRLYVAYVDNYNVPAWLSTADGQSFSTIVGDGDHSASTSASPNLAVFNGTLYMGYATAQDSATPPNVLAMTRINSDNSFSSALYSNVSLGDSPGLGVYNNQLYIAFRDTSGSNFINLAVSSDGANFNLNSAATSSHTSTAPSIVVRSGILYIIFRQNDTGDRLYYNYSTDGANFFGPIEVSLTMGGPPAAVFVSLPGSPLDGKLLDVFRQNDSGHYLFTTSTP